jgi:hypothetical protein
LIRFIVVVNIVRIISISVGISIVCPLLWWCSGVALVLLC